MSLLDQVIESRESKKESLEFKTIPKQDAIEATRLEFHGRTCHKCNYPLIPIMTTVNASTALAAKICSRGCRVAVPANEDDFKGVMNV